MNNPMSAEQLAGLNSEELLSQLDKLKHAAFTLGPEMAQAELRYRQAKDLLPIYLARIQEEQLAQGRRVTEAGVLARASVIYQTYVESANELGAKHAEKEAHFKAILKSIDALQSIGWVRHQELKLARG